MRGESRRELWIERRKAMAENAVAFHIAVYPSAEKPRKYEGRALISRQAVMAHEWGLGISSGKSGPVTPVVQFIARVKAAQAW